MKQYCVTKYIYLEFKKVEVRQCFSRINIQNFQNVIKTRIPPKKHKFIEHKTEDT